MSDSDIQKAQLYAFRNEIQKMYLSEISPDEEETEEQSSGLKL